MAARIPSRGVSRYRLRTKVGRTQVDTVPSENRKNKQKTNKRQQENSLLGSSSQHGAYSYPTSARTTVYKKKSPQPCLPSPDQISHRLPIAQQATPPPISMCLHGYHTSHLVMLRNDSCPAVSQISSFTCEDHAGTPDTTPPKEAYRTAYIFIIREPHNNVYGFWRRTTETRIEKK